MWPQPFPLLYPYVCLTVWVPKPLQWCTRNSWLLGSSTNTNTFVRQRRNWGQAPVPIQPLKQNICPPLPDFQTFLRLCSSSSICILKISHSHVRTCSSTIHMIAQMGELKLGFYWEGLETSNKFKYINKINRLCCQGQFVLLSSSYLFEFNLIICYCDFVRKASFDIVLTDGPTIICRF